LVANTAVAKPTASVCTKHLII